MRRGPHARRCPDVHANPVAAALAALLLVLVVSRRGGAVASWLRQPPVLGELLAGIVLGNLQLAGFHGFEFIRDNAVTGGLATVGAILLLFQAGLESTVNQMMRVGPSAFLVATIGV